jgi:hypothetical protein
VVESLEIELEPGSTRFDPTDERWLGQVRDLTRELQRADVLLRRSTPQPGAKGAIDQLVLSLGSAGAFTASVELIKAWLGRDHGRKLVVKFFENGRLEAIELSGGAADEHVFERIQSRFAG